MFPLYEKELPKTASDLSRMLTSSLQRALEFAGDRVSVRENTYPDLAEIAIDLSDARVRLDAPRPLLPAGKGAPAITAQHFVLNAHPLAVGGAALNLTIDAHGIVLHQSADSAGDLFLLVKRVEDGRIAISIPQRDLEMLIEQVAKTEAGKQGVAIEQVQLSLTSHGPHSLTTELRLQARKLFIRATIRIAGQLEIDEQLVARVSGLTCAGDGAIATLACGVLAPHLRKLESRNFPLMALALGEVELRDVKLEASDGIMISAEFGAKNAQRPA